MARLWRWLTKHGTVTVGCLLIAVVVLVALFAPHLAPHDPLQQDIALRLKPPGFRGGDGQFFLLGTDQLGRDILSRIIFGARISLWVGISAVVLSLILGTVLGLLAGFYGGWLDTVLMRLVDIQMSFPFILLALSLLSVLGTSLRTIIVVFALSSWPVYARTVRASVLALREREFIQAEHALGASTVRILLRHILPNAVNPLIVVATSEAARMIIMETALGFLGLGIQPPSAAWGNMLADGRKDIFTAWWSSTYPGMAIMVTVFGINMLGDGLRDLLDPRRRRQA